MSEQILSPRRFCPPGHNPLAEIVPHGHNPLADIVPLPQILSPPPPPLQPMRLAVPVFLIGVRLSGPISPARFLHRARKVSLAHTPSPSHFSPAVLSIYLPARRPGCGSEYCPLRPSTVSCMHVVRFAAASSY